ncbi:hypothetical protein [Lyngbya aestuarii]
MLYLTGVENAVDWNNFNESGDFKSQVEAFKEYTGRYPESVHALDRGM